jgi:hypothetical protein
VISGISVRNLESNTFLNFNQNQSNHMKILMFSVLLLSGSAALAQTQLVTTGNNVMDASNPYAADVVIGSDAAGGIRHDGSIMLWSSYSAARISGSGTSLNFSVWNNPQTPNVSLATDFGGASFLMGNVGIGTAAPQDKLTVAGRIGAREIKVSTNAGADFVFEPAYKLPELAELEKFVKTNKHLPEIPTARQMVENGVNLGELNIKLLQKVEELTLHLIEKDKQLKNEKEVNKKQQVNIDGLEKGYLELKEQLQLLMKH